mgnify:CR=1 FL=1
MRHKAPGLIPGSHEPQAGFSPLVWRRFLYGFLAAAALTLAAMLAGDLLA